MRKIIKLFPEIVALPAVMVAWWLVTKILPVIYPTAGIIDEGIIQVPIIALVFLLIGNFVVYAGIKYNEPFIWKWYKENLEDYSLDVHWLFLAMYTVRLIAFAVIMTAIA
jgi:hypothetical protein